MISSSAWSRAPAGTLRENVQIGVRELAEHAIDLPETAAGTEEGQEDLARKLLRFGVRQGEDPLGE